MKYLVDTSVWISHFKKADDKLIALLKNDEVVVHPFIIQELYLGKPPGKEFIFDRLQKLPNVTIIDKDSFVGFVDEFSIVGKGVGALDTHLLASAYINGCKLYTYDKKLKTMADRILRF